MYTPYGNGLCNYTFVMTPRDAIVGLFCTPPPTKYFSIRSYVGFRFRPSAWLPAVELADPASNAVINTTARLAPDEEGQLDVFAKTSLFISTADGVTARCVVQRSCILIIPCTSASHRLTTHHIPPAINHPTTGTPAGRSRRPAGRRRP